MRAIFTTPLAAVALPDPVDLIFPGLLALVAVLIAVVARAAHARQRRTAFLRECAIVLSAHFVYFAVRGATEGAAESAIENARRIEDFERTLGIYLEPRLQGLIVDHSLLVDAANVVYIWGHWPVIGIVALWLFHARERRYFVYRDAFLISGAIGLVCFWMAPTAPPRLVDVGLVDTVFERSDFYRVLQPPQLTNQFAAFPSLHFGWDLLIGVALVREGQRPAVRLVGFLLPIAMFVAIVLTANHYILDGLVGGLLALLGLWLAMGVRGWRARRRTANALG